MTNLFVFDTNCLISAILFSHTIPALALQKAQTTGFLICSDETYAELCEVLMRPKFDRYLSRESRQYFLSNYRSTALWIDVSHSISDCRDSKDNKFLEVAMSANASHLISGDKDLLVLHPYRNLQILTPASFLLTFIL